VDERVRNPPRRPGFNLHDRLRKAVRPDIGVGQNQNVGVAGLNRRIDGDALAPRTRWRLSLD
jgi:hypothetical protein